MDSNLWFSTSPPTCSRDTQEVLGQFLDTAAVAVASIDVGQAYSWWLTSLWMPKTSCGYYDDDDNDNDDNDSTPYANNISKFGPWISVLIDFPPLFLIISCQLRATNFAWKELLLGSRNEWKTPFIFFYYSFFFLSLSFYSHVVSFMVLPCLLYKKKQRGMSWFILSLIQNPIFLSHCLSSALISSTFFFFSQSLAGIFQVA